MRVLLGGIDVISTYVEVGSFVVDIWSNTMKTVTDVRLASDTDSGKLFGSVLTECT